MAFLWIKNIFKSIFSKLIHRIKRTNRGSILNTKTDRGFIYYPQNIKPACTLVSEEDKKLGYQRGEKRKEIDSKEIERKLTTKLMKAVNDGLGDNKIMG